MPDTTHYVEDTGRRSRVYTAICGSKVHSGEMKHWSSSTPSCETCKRMLADFDAEEEGPVDAYNHDRV